MMHGLLLDQVFVEEGVSGSMPIQDRPQGSALFAVLQPGDVITKVNRVRIRTLAEAVPVMENARAILLEVERRGRSSLILMR